MNEPLVISSPPARKYLDSAFNPGYQPLPEELWQTTLAEIISWRARRQPEALALVDHEGSSAYGELESASNRAAHAILAVFDSPEDFVPLLFGRQRFIAVGMLAALKAGRIHAPLETSFPFKQLEDILAALNARAILTNTANLGLARKLGLPLLNLDEILEDPRYPDSLPGIKVTPEHDFAVIFTSGSTGASKGVLANQASRLQGARQGFARRQLAPNDRVAHLGNPNYASGHGNLLNSLMAGATHYLFDVERKGLAGFGDWLDRHGITTLNCPPALYRQVARSVAGARLESLRLISAGADKLMRSDLDLLRENFPPGCLLATGFASSEVGGLANIVYRADDEFEGDQLPAGYILPEAEVFIWDDNSQPLPSGEVGEIVAWTPQISSGYLSNESLNQEKFVPHPYDPARLVCRTGDLGWLTEDGLLYFRGRKDFQVKLRGMNVNAQEVSAALLMHPQVLEAAVLAHSDSQGSRRLAAYLAADEPRPTPRALREFLQPSLAAFKIPSFFIFVETLPKLPNGKVNFKALPPPDGQRPALSSEYVPPRTELERRLTAIWEDVLDIRPIGVGDAFHELGGDSLQAARIFVEIHRQLGHYLPPAVLYTAATIAALAESIQTGAHTEINRSFLVPVQQGDGRPPLVFFVTPQRGDILGYHDIIRHLPPDLTIYGFNSWTMAQKDWNQQSLPELAARYVAEIQRVAGSAPCVLGGHSLGGLIAYEMARQLGEKGIPVALLFMMDTSGPGHTGNSLFSMSFRYLRKHVAAMNTKERIQFVLRRVRGLPGYGRRIVNIIENRLGVQWLPRPEAFKLGKSMRGEYLPPSQDVPMLYFRSTADRTNNELDNTRGWASVVAGAVDVRLIPGDHFTHLLEESGAEIARHLTAAIRAVQAG
ncbi:MAG: alpha/beta fold hydrolase [Chloroflexi bacterium]|nr:alpha/beta fold hydrolase [Chloroflexota bacterium]